MESDFSLEQCSHGIGCNSAARSICAYKFGDSREIILIRNCMKSIIDSLVSFMIPVHIASANGFAGRRAARAAAGEIRAELELRSAQSVAQ